MGSDQKKFTNEELKAAKKIIAEIEAHIEKCGGDISDWYVGITGDIDQRLFKDHAVKKNYIYRPAPSSDVARVIEKFLLDDCGASGGPGGGDDDSVYVYAYKITDDTVE